MKPWFSCATLCLAAAGVLAFSGCRQEESEAKENDEWGEISVKAVQPREDPNFQMSVTRPCDVMPYFHVDLEARVAGEVRKIRVAPGSSIEKGQSLAKIYVPDLKAAAQEKFNNIAQRERELKLVEAKTVAARVGVDTAKANVEEKRTLLVQAKAQTQYRKLQFDRFEYLWRSKSIAQEVRDEAEKNFEVGKAVEAAATAARIKAESEVKDAEANVKVMEAEEERVRQLIEVAKADYEEAWALFGYSDVKAPFRGTVVARKVDPGSFVQNASTGHPTPLLTLERTDIMTVVMRVPDNFAPFVTRDTEALIELDSLPGVKIVGKVTRLSDSLLTAENDRTMQVEVDLWNGSPDAYKQFFADSKNLDDLKDGPRPVVPKYTCSDAQQCSTRLRGGMYGRMTLILRKLGHSYLIPSGACMHQGGRTYIYVVQDGKAHRIPVQVQVDDGNLAKVVRLGKNLEVTGEMTPSEQVIVSNQEELAEGQPVKAVLVKDWLGLKTQDGVR